MCENGSEKTTGHDSTINVRLFPFMRLFIDAVLIKQTYITRSNITVLETEA